VKTNENIENVKDFFTRYHNASIRIAEADLGVSRTSVQRILKEEGLKWHPYKLQLPHALEAEDHATRLEFCTDQLEVIDEVIDNILFTDESIFTTAGFVNRHNFRYWAPSRPADFVLLQVPMHPAQVHAWAGVGSRGIIGPFFFGSSVNSATYRGKFR
jgi:hypothetical protein